MSAERRTVRKKLEILRKVCFSEKPPYVLTLFLALIVYSINNIINQEIESPVICYSLNEIPFVNASQQDVQIQNVFRSYNRNDKSINSLRKRHMRYELENISLSNSINQLYISIKFKANDVAGNSPVYFFGEEVIPISPAPLQNYKTGDSTLDVVRAKAARNIISLKINNFQPDTKFNIDFYVACNKNIVADPAIYLNSNATVRFKEKSWEEFLVINRFYLNVGLFFFFLGMLTIYFITSYKNYQNENLPVSSGTA